MRGGTKIKSVSESAILHVYVYRVALTPVVTAALVKKGFTVNVESGAGIEARFRNDDYVAAGGKLTDKTTAFKSGKLMAGFQHRPPIICFLCDFAQTLF